MAYDIRFDLTNIHTLPELAEWFSTIFHQVGFSLDYTTAILSLGVDGGNATAIPVDKSAYIPIVTAGAETRTLAIPTFRGQQLMLCVKTDGGTCVITSAQAINQAANTVATMADAGDFLYLVGVDIGGVLRWRIAANDGVTLA